MNFFSLTLPPNFPDLCLTLNPFLAKGATCGPQINCTRTLACDSLSRLTPNNKFEKNPLSDWEEQTATLTFSKSLQNKFLRFLTFQLKPFFYKKITQIKIKFLEYYKLKPFYFKFLFKI